MLRTVSLHTRHWYLLQCTKLFNLATQLLDTFNSSCYRTHHSEPNTTPHLFYFDAIHTLCSTFHMQFCFFLTKIPLRQEKMYNNNSFLKTPPTNTCSLVHCVLCVVWLFKCLFRVDWSVKYETAVVADILAFERITWL